MASSLLNRWVNRLKDSAREEIQETVRSAVLYTLAALTGLIAVVFLTLAALWWLALDFGLIVSALIITAFYVLVAVIFLVWAASRGSEPHEVRERHETPAYELRSAAGVTSDMPGRAGIDLDTVAMSLRDAGFRAEGAVIAASSEVLKQLTPLQFVALVFAGSFLFGRRIARRR